MTLPPPPDPSPGIIAIVMGSDSDLPVMSAAIAICEQFAVRHHVHFLSAHRTPEAMVSYAKTAHQEGIRVIIAGAGGAAHLPGMVAALTPLPVIGVPVPGGMLQGLDALYAIVQMPRGIPVATVAIGNAQNAGLLAIQILGLQYPHLMAQVQLYRQQLQQMVFDKEAELQQTGYRAYLQTHFPQLLK
ncbi:MAG: 5-(carboxyamino)imidazole ribonucleotide mutase [Cyanobacteriota bacterium]|nr:5-(carboxyamino)imidazole ribonucleotide mutase [Cyanobacteriota bacterium]